MPTDMLLDTFSKKIDPLIQGLSPVYDQALGAVQKAAPYALTCAAVYLSPTIGISLLASSIRGLKQKHHVYPEYPWSYVDISKDRFVQMINDLSEIDPNKGDNSYWYPNYISNELYQCHTVAALGETGGVYLGTGPHQNYSYILKTKPAVAFIIDIRRDNMIQHLFLRAVMDLSTSRADFLSKILLRNTPEVSSCEDNIECILEEVQKAPRLKQRESLIEEIAAKIESYGIQLQKRDHAVIKHHLNTFGECGLENSWQGCYNPECSDFGGITMCTSRPKNYPTWRQIILACGEKGDHWLSTEEDFQTIKEMHGSNRIIPLVADFAGPYTFQALSHVLKKWGLSVSTFYVSNVELYLKSKELQMAFLKNVSALPITEKSHFIRAFHSGLNDVPEITVADESSANCQTYSMTFQNINLWAKSYEKATSRK